jgi:O-antigen ligase
LYLGGGLVVGTLAVSSFRFLAAAPSWLLSGAGLALVGFAGVLFGLLLLASGSQRGQALDPAKACLRLALVVWWALLVSEEVFWRTTPEARSFAGHFSEAAYGEAAFWGVAFLALLLASKPEHFRGALSGGNKWLSLFALVCIISAPFSPTPLYSMAWAFKLFLVLLVLLLLSAVIRQPGDIEAFLWSNLWGFAVLSVAPVVRAFLNPSGAFEEGRLWGSPTGLSASAGTLLLIGLTLNYLRKRTWLVGFAIVGATVMIMAGGKAGIAAGVASLAIFFAVQKRVAAGLGWLFGVSALGCVILAVTPLSTYFISYQEAGYLSTMSGRTELWQAAWPDIVQRPIVGHGYLASRFLSEQVEGAFPEAGHMHNGFIEALYNNGLLGLIILVVIHIVIVRNLWQALRAPPNREAKMLAVGSCAVYVNLLINGFFNATFGGRASPPFMLLLGLVVVSETLRRMTEHPAPAT